MSQEKKSNKTLHKSALDANNFIHEKFGRYIVFFYIFSTTIISGLTLILSFTCVKSPISPEAVLRRLMGVRPSVIRVDFSPRDCSSLTYTIYVKLDG